MRTTLDLPDNLFRQAKAKAAVEGTTLKELLTRYVELGLRQPVGSPAPAAQRSELPVIKRRGRGIVPALTPELQAQIETEEDLAKLARSFRR